MNTRAPELCPRCGEPLPADAPGGACPRCLMAMNFATETAFTGAEPAPPGTPLSPAELAPHFPSLEMLECLGRGGMGVVYKARQKSLNRLVALKLLAPERVTDPEFARRFAREAEALAGLSHPGIVTVHDFGESAGRFYLLMEYVDGVNLRQAMRAGRFTAGQALAIVPTICEALQYAHEHGIVHRDIKPENLLLDKAGRVKIADFGIAKILGTEASANGIEESRGAGTPRYMAPEQLRDPAAVDHRADIYSLGVVLYEMLTGDLPAPGVNLRGTVGGLRIDVRLDEIVVRALQQQPEQRYHSAREFQTVLETVTGPAVSPRSPAQPIPAMSHLPPPPPLPPSPRARRGLLKILGLIVAIPVLLVIIVVIALLSRTPTYYAQVTMEVRPEGAAAVRAFSSSDVMTEKFVGTQFQILRKAELLDPVIEQLELKRAYAGGGAPLPPDAVRERLLRSLRTEWVRHTDLVEVGIYDTDPQRAANIANTLAVVYRNQRLEAMQRALERGLEQFQREVDKQRNHVNEAYLKAAQLRAKLGISDPDLESDKPSPAEKPKELQSSPDPALNWAEAKPLFDEYAEAKARYAVAKQVLHAAEARLSSARMEQSVDVEPVRIWERATPPSRPLPWWHWRRQ